MWTGRLAGRTVIRAGTQVTLGCFLDRIAQLLIQNRQALAVVDGDHLNVRIRATVGTGSTADARRIVDRHTARLSVPRYGSCRAADHAHRIQAMHARIGDHPIVVLLSVSNESRVVVVRRRTGSNTIIASGTSLQIDHHGLSAVDEPLLNQKLQQTLVHTLFTLNHPASLGGSLTSRVEGWQLRRQLRGWNLWQN